MSPKKLRLALLSFVICTLISVGAIGAVTRGREAITPKPKEMLAIAEANGLPASLKDLYRGYEVAAEDNCFDELKTLGKQLNRDRVAKFQLLQQIKYFEKAQNKKEAADKILQQSSPFLDPMKVVAAKKGFTNRDLVEDNYQIRDRSGEIMQDTVAIFCGRAVSWAHIDQPEKAIEELKLASRVHSLLRNQPSFLGSLDFLQTAADLRMSAVKIAQASQGPKARLACREVINKLTPTDTKRALQEDFYRFVALLTGQVIVTAEELVTVRENSDEPFFFPLQGLWEREQMERLVQAYQEVQAADTIREIAKAGDKYNRWQITRKESKVLGLLVEIPTRSLAAFQSFETRKQLALIALDSIESGKKPIPTDYRDPDSGKHPVLIDLPRGWALLYPGWDMANSGKLLERNGVMYAENDIALIYQDGTFRISGR